MQNSVSAHPVDLAIIDCALAEDIGSGDLTARIIPAGQQATATLTVRESAVFCGRAWFDAVFARLDAGSVTTDWRIEDGQQVAPGTLLCVARGKARTLLTGERTALNLLQTLCATATRARRYAHAVAGTECRVLDTRKTLPGLRTAQKYAVRCGGCHNHRQGLYDGILIKENHILAAGSIAAAVAAARALGAGVLIEVEVENLDELHQALAAEVERILLDNFDLTRTREAVVLTNGRAELEASGNIALDNIRELAETGVDFISVGDLTKNVQAVDLSFRIALDA